MSRGYRRCGADGGDGAAAAVATHRARWAPVNRRRRNKKPSRPTRARNLAGGDNIGGRGSHQKRPHGDTGRSQRQTPLLLPPPSEAR